MQLGPLKTKCRDCKEHVIVTLEQARADQAMACLNGHVDKARAVIEADLVTGVNNGSYQHFEWFIGLFDRELRFVIFSYLNSKLPTDIARVETEDTVHELYLAILRNGIGKIDKSLTGYLKRAAHHKAVDTVRRRRGKYVQEMNDEESLETTFADERLALDRRFEIRMTFEDGLNQLSDEQRDIVRLRLIEERSEREVADRLSVEEGTVKSRLNRARVILRRLFENNK